MEDNDSAIQLALSLEGEDATGQEKILLKLFGTEDLSDKRRYKALAIQLHPDKNKEREKEATKAMQLFLHAIDFQAKARADSGLPFLEKVAIDRVKLGLRLVGQVTELRNAGPWNACTVKLTDFNEETLSFKAFRPDENVLWTGMVAVHPSDAKVDHVIRLSSEEAAGDLTAIKPQQGYCYRLTRRFISDGLRFVNSRELPAAPRNFSDFGAQRILRAEGLELTESFWFFYEHTFTTRLREGASLTTPLDKVELRILETFSTGSGGKSEGVEVVFAQVCNPFDVDFHLALGNISHDLIEAFVLRQRLDRETLLAIEQKAEQNLLAIANEQRKDTADFSADQPIGSQQAPSMALALAQETDRLIMEQSKKSFVTTLGKGILNQDGKEADKKEIIWFEFPTGTNPVQYLKRLVGIGGLTRTGIEPWDCIRFVCVHPRTDKRVHNTDEYMISLHVSCSESWRSRERERVGSELLDDLVAKGVIRKCDVPEEKKKLCCNAQTDFASDFSDTGSKPSPEDAIPKAPAPKTDELIEMARDMLGKTITRERAEKMLTFNGNNVELAMNRLMDEL